MKRRIKLIKVKPLLNSKDPQIQERLKLVETMATDLMTKYSVGHLKFKFTGAIKEYGSCDGKTIRLSVNRALNHKIDYVKNTLLHEIAHAIVGLHNGHREVWQIKAKELGVVWRQGHYRK